MVNHALGPGWGTGGVKTVPEGVSQALPALDVHIMVVVLPWFFSTGIDSDTRELALASGCWAPPRCIPFCRKYHFLYVVANRNS